MFLEVTTVEGVLRRTIAGLQQDQPLRRANEPEDADKIETYVKRIEDLLNLNQPFHVVSFF
jgi:zinc finger protein